MTKFRKITIGIVLAVTAVLIAWDIYVVLQSPEDTISSVMMSTIYKFPFVGYAWMLLAGHFLSLIPTKKRYIRELIIISSLVLVVSFLTVFGVLVSNTKILALLALVGFCTGSFTWSQKRIKE